MLKKSQALNAVNATKKGSEHEETEEQHSELDKFTICVAVVMSSFRTLNFFVLVFKEGGN